jgi:ribosomal protein L40E
MQNPPPKTRLENPPRQVDAAMQNPLPEIDPQHQRAQGALRLFGRLMMGLGVILTGIGMVSYFSSRNKFQPPSNLWGVMVGLPLVGIGASLTNLGQHHEILRNLADEVSPVRKDSVDLMAEDTQHGVETMAHAVGRGLTTAMNGDGLSEPETILCNRCDAANPADAKFCNQCGTSLLSQKCPECGASITPTARFCNHCGKLVG